MDKLTNSDRLRLLKEEHTLTTQDVADLLGVSHYTVKSWLLHADSEAARAMKDRDLMFLRLRLAARLNS